MLLRLVFVFLLCRLVGAASVQAQPYQVAGQVTEDGTGEPLAFVNVVVNDGLTGTTTNIDGRFAVNSPVPVTHLRFSFVGYEPVTVQVAPGQAARLEVKMRATATSLAELVVRPGENPAHRLVWLVLQNRDRHNPDKLPAFRYKSYNKLVLTAKRQAADMADTLRLAQPLDSAELELRNLLDKQHFFLMETITERSFLAPQHSQEVVLASRMSGFRKANLGFLATNLQPFSFYSDFIDLSGETYLNPISKGSTRKYHFQLKDTTYSGPDTVFIVSFKPRQGKNFDALQGLLYISNNGWALQNVVAEPVEGKLKGMRIQQQYRQVNGSQWFPVQLNTDFVMPNVDMGTFQPVAISRSYITAIDLNPNLHKRDFGAAAVRVEESASEQPPEFWQQYRPDSLDTKELRTYQMIDSLGQKHNFDTKLRLAEALASGRYPLGLVDLDVSRLLAVNRYEGVRLGAGLYTSSRVSRFFTVGGYGGYGFRDKGFKYGADATFRLFRPASLELTVAFAEDLKESAGIFLPFQGRGIFSTRLRYLAVSNMDQVETRSIGLSFRSMRYLQMQGLMRQEHKRPTNGYVFGQHPDVWASRFRFTESVLGLRYAYREQLAQTGPRLVSIGSDYPVVWLQFTQGLKGVLDGQYSYRKYDARLEGSFRTRLLGLTRLELAAGLAQGIIPYPNLYNGQGSFSKKVRIVTSEGFETMAPGEFISDRYASLFLQHDFGRLLFRSKKFSPYLSVVTNVGYGSLQQPDHHRLAYREGFPFQTMQKGYYESGLIANDLLRMQFNTFGAGLYYRYGAYRHPKPVDNLAIKLSMAYRF